MKMIKTTPGSPRPEQKLRQAARRYNGIECFSGIALCCLFAAGASAQPTYTIINVTGAGTAAGQGTLAESINTSGVIAGNYWDSSNVTHGFVRAANGTITTFSYSGAGTAAGQGTGGCYGINA